MKLAILFLLATVVVSTIAESSFRLRSAHMAAQKREVNQKLGCLDDHICWERCRTDSAVCIDGQCICYLVKPDDSKNMMMRSAAWTK
ncbi:hypothetical protein B5X24_HaOG214295 [Helicoverpa armigera]|nr:hypothetical protein B5X24_HaOG214295 [Helicoverpa armigera]